MKLFQYPSFTALTSAFLLRCPVNGAIIKPKTVERGRSVPVIGRGYSIDTGDVGATCIDVQRQKNPTFDIHTYFEEMAGIHNTTTSDYTYPVSLSNSLNYEWIRELIINDVATSGGDLYWHHLISLIVVDKYMQTFSSSSTLSAEADALLLEGRYADFFQNCGPSYIKSMRRKAETAIVYAYQNDSETPDEEFNQAIKMGVSDYQVGQQGQTGAEAVQNYAFANSLKILINSYGLAKKYEKQYFMTPKNFVDVHRVTKSLYELMIGRMNTGVVVSIEALSWASDPMFQSAAGLNLVLEDEDGHPIPSAIRRYNLFSNANHIAAMDYILQKDSNMVASIGQCVTSLVKMPSYLKSSKLVNRKFPFMDQGDLKTADELLALLTPGGEHVYKERMTILRNYINNYYEPCITALTSEFSGLLGGSMQAMNWLDLESCFSVSCIYPNHYYDENTMGCIPWEVTDTNFVDNIVNQYCMPEVLDEISITDETSD